MPPPYAPDGLPLQGLPVLPSCDSALGAAMRENGVAVHEEAVHESLLAGLSAKTRRFLSVGAVSLKA